MLSVALLAVGCCKQQSNQPKLEDECLYSPEQTDFAFWSNIAEQMELRLYAAPDAQDFQTVALTKNENDFWTASVSGDLVG